MTDLPQENILKLKEALTNRLKELNEALVKIQHDISATNGGLQVCEYLLNPPKDESD